MPPSGHIRTESEDRQADAVSGRVATVTIDYPNRLNVLNTPIVQDLTDTVRRLSADGELRAIVLTGAGDRAFIGGADLYELVDLNPRTAEVFITGIHTLCSALRDCPVPVIARINGHCLGGGLVVAAACDLRAAADNASFGMPEVRVGIPSVIESALLPGMIGWGRARELLYTGDTIDAATAADWGLVERVVPSAQLDVTVDAWLDSILACGPRAVRAQKALVHKWDSLPTTAAIAVGIPVFSAAYTTDEPHTFMKRFLDRKRSG
jgi:enoyl-CoA hydratase